MTRSLLTALALALVALPTAARAPQNADPDLAPWFAKQRNPLTGGYCCDKGDGHILPDDAWRAAGSSWELRRGPDAPWEKVPPEAIIPNVDNPTGGAVAFWLPPTGDVLCFVLPSMT